MNSRNPNGYHFLCIFKKLPEKAPLKSLKMYTDQK